MPKVLRATRHIGNVGEHSFSAEQLRQWRKTHHRETPGDVLGPFFRTRAPFQAKVSPPLAKGETLVIAGRVRSETGKLLPHVRLEIWQADADGHYDNQDHAHPPPKDVFVNRVQLLSDQFGRYEFETIYPGPYKMDARTWRTPHIHYKVHARGHKTLVTQLFFAGAPYLDSDPFMKKSLIIRLRAVQAPGGPYWRGTFNIVMARRKRRVARRSRR
jgi:protocatechuate 3,4-dioxygenase beta subunit